MSTCVKQLSRKGATSDSLTHEALNTGSLMRIADATELMAKNHASLLRDKEWAEGRVTALAKENKRMAHVIIGLRGRITRLKAAA